MNQQTLMAVRRVYPLTMAEMALDEECAVQHAQEIPGGHAMCTQASMARNLEKILSITQLSWTASRAPETR